ncbi:MAG TPA: hypothetical protein VGR91_08830 [Stellaceae bacterium]|nr:hypothetical protein [Stellaceae bacterium]
MSVYKPICERWAEEADARNVRERAALVDGQLETPTPPLAEWAAALCALAATIRSILPTRR